MKNFGEHLKQIRLENDLTIRELAKKTNLSIGSISLYENNKIIPTATSIIQYAKALNISADYILDLKKEKNN